MILLQAIRLDLRGERFQFRIDAPKQPSSVMTEEEAREILAELGVDDPGRFIAHVKVWGVVEIQEGDGVSPAGTC